MSEHTGMGPARYERIKELFSMAIGIERTEREALLSRACASDVELRGDVERLLAAHDDATFLENPDEQLARLWSMASDEWPVAVDDAPPPIPERLGRYRLVRRLGEGGMAVVYEARQDRPERAVALKVIRPSPGMPGLRLRLQLEAQILGRLQHTNIAQVYEAGAFESDFGPLPFVAMELVDGEPIDRFTRSRAASVEDRLRLLIDVCAAVEHAHQRGVVHRDLKPANILVTRDGVAKVLDFGVARLFNTDIQATTLHTASGQIVGTLQYMSPEQAAGDVDAVDTRSDVYALGVLAYELLAGRPPLDLKHRAIPEAVRMIRDADPVPLGTVDRRLRGDLETVVSKAMAKDKERRYPSASAFGSDLRRVIEHQPVEARPATVVYQLRKMARRHRGAFAASTIVLLTLSAGTVGTTAGMVRAVRERDHRAVEAQTAQEVTAFLVDVLHAGDPRADGTMTLREAVDRAAAKVDQLKNPRVRARVLLTLGDVYGSLGEYDISIRQLEEALDWLEQEPEADPLLIARGLQLLGHSYNRISRFDEAMAVTTRAYDLTRAAAGDTSLEAAAAMASVGLVHLMAGDLDLAEQWLSRSLELMRRLPDLPPAELAFRMNDLADVIADRGDSTRAAALFEEAEQILRREFPDGHPRLANLLNSTAMEHLAADRYDEAERDLRESIDMRIRLIGPDDPYLAFARGNLAEVLRQVDRLEEAAELQRQALNTHLAHGGRETRQVAIAMNNLAITLASLGQVDEAEPLFRESIETRRRLFGERHLMVVSPMRSLARLLRESGRAREAESLAREAHSIRVEQLGPLHEDTLNAFDGVVEVELELGNAPAAMADALLALNAKLETRSEDSTPVLVSRVQLARAQHMVGDLDAARASFELAYQRLSEEAMIHPLLADFHDQYARLLADDAIRQIGDGRLVEAEQTIALARQFARDASDVVDAAARRLAEAGQGLSAGPDREPYDDR